METLELEEEVEAFTEGVSENEEVEAFTEGVSDNEQKWTGNIPKSSVVKTASVPESSGTALQDGQRSI